MTPKFQRACKLEIGVDPDAQGKSKALTIAPEFTVEFTVRREMLSSAQEATFRVYNLGQTTRDRIFKDLNTVPTDGSGEAVLRPLRFRAGYGDFQPLIFNGFIRSAVSYRDGVNFVTEIEGYDGGFGMTYAQVAQTIGGDGSETTEEDIIRLLESKLPDTTGAPIIGSWPKKVVTTRGVTLVGNVWSIICQRTGNKAFVDNGQLKVLDDTEAINGEIAVINSDSGLLGSPRRGLNRIELTMLFEPRFTVGQIVKLESATWEAVNRTYRVVGFTHRGTISPAVAGDCTTEVILYGPSQFSIVEGKAVTS